MMKIAFAAAATAALLSANATSAQEAYMSQIVPMAGNNSCPRGWLPADGRLMPLTQNHALFSLLGTTYGGDGKTTFALPNLKGGTIGPAGPPITWCIAINGVFPPPP
jgi:microcystin-dependent protein